jgi:DNA helicase IV
MKREWGPTSWGSNLTLSPDWRVRLEGETLVVSVNGKERLRQQIGEKSPIKIRLGTFWADLTFPPNPRLTFALDGLPNAEVKGLEQAIADVISAREAKRADTRRQTFNSAYALIDEWFEDLVAHMLAAQNNRRWVSIQQQQRLLGQRPKLNVSIDTLWELFRDPDVQAQLPANRERVENWLTYWQRDWSEYFGRKNKEHIQRELAACKELFDNVESKPLTEEQARAVICFENNVQVVASAGSGKTSTMIAKAAYAIHREFVAPEQVLLLAFNKSAADELQERAAKAFERLEMPDTKVEARTFHSLGRSIIGKATGRMPDVPEWAIEAEPGIQKLRELVDCLKDGTDEFRDSWDLFRLVFGRDLPRIGETGEADEWDKDGKGYVRTLRGERVRSNEERVIANWLFYNGVDYVYERKYEHDTRTDEHRQYRPDFYYPEIALYHEHLALNADGQPPPHFKRYLEELRWKRAEHRRRGTDLLETTSHQMRTGQLFTHLSAALRRKGIVLDPNPERPIPDGGQAAMGDSELVTLIRSFINHAKSNGLNVDDLRKRTEGLQQDQFSYRHKLFVELAIPVMQAWDAALQEEEGIDFEDMLNQAAEHVESGRYVSDFYLVMADEFQDASRARARLCRALARARIRFGFRVGRKPMATPLERNFFAVGDDWQSINRFAGADVSVMTGFRDYFGHGEVLKLETTFRCPQALCDISSQFVVKNPVQIEKKVTSTKEAKGPVQAVYQVENRDELRSAVDKYLNELYEGLRRGTIAAGHGGKVSVFVLGRYRRDRAYVPLQWERRFGRYIELVFLTVHKSKGAEADYVILPCMINRGFPNTRTDDPVLAIAMPEGDHFPHGEERRLFYVALTRARRSVSMFTVAGQSSCFVDELVADHGLTVTNVDGEPVNEERCPACKSGVMVERVSRFGPFRSCSNYPRCQFKPRKQAVSTRMHS